MWICARPESPPTQRNAAMPAAASATPMPPDTIETSVLSVMRRRT